MIVGRTLQTVGQNVFVLFQNTAMFGTVIPSESIHRPGISSARILGREVMFIGASKRSRSAASCVQRSRSRTTMRRRWCPRCSGTYSSPGSVSTAPGAANNLISFRVTMKDIPNLPAEYIVDMERSFSGVFYNRMINGEWNNAEGAAYPMWEPKRQAIPWGQMPRLRDVWASGWTARRTPPRLRCSASSTSRISTTRTDRIPFPLRPRGRAAVRP